MSNPLAADLNHILDQTRDVWQEVDGNRIFITGGTGFFGSWLLESFAWAVDQLDIDTRAVVLTRNREAFQKKAPHLANHPAIQFHPGDVRTFDFPEGPFSHVIHGATESSTQLNNDNPLLMLDTIIQGTRRSLEFAVHCGAQKFLLVSSGAVYGKQPPDMTHIPEGFSGAPDTATSSSSYGEGKRVAELLCSIYAKQDGLETKIARCFAFVGPYLPLDAHFAVGNFIRDGLEGGPIVVKGDGTPYRSYLYAADLAIWLWIILSKGQSNRPYNVGSEVEISISELASRTAEICSLPVSVCVSQKPPHGKSQDRYVPSTARSQRELELKTNADLSSAIGKTFSWYESERKRDQI